MVMVLAPKKKAAPAGKAESAAPRASGEALAFRVGAFLVDVPDRRFTPARSRPGQPRMQVTNPPRPPDDRRFAYWAALRYDKAAFPRGKAASVQGVAMHVLFVLIPAALEGAQRLAAGGRPFRVRDARFVRFGSLAALEGVGQFGRHDARAGRARAYAQRGHAGRPVYRGSAVRAGHAHRAGRRADLHGHDWWREAEARDVRLADLGAVVMRKDPPFDMEYVFHPSAGIRPAAGRQGLQHRRGHPQSPGKAGHHRNQRVHRAHAGDPQHGPKVFNTGAAIRNHPEKLAITEAALHPSRSSRATSASC